ncbi:4Fe-4S binding domain protein [uncultured Desulfobacterium sp.]|uniref:glutamate synthase (NADPH) n=1 Tax=uncultured Desulfobacterium sp. TaxID=201089 RepID=A0A445MVV2_9BACT|nr:4Fe-4S binding domain protein [uncultured Desulfobacterium sp.]
MPEKYVIHTTTAPNRFKAVSRSGIIAWEEGCLRCAVCVKERCVYDVYYKRKLDPRQMIDSIDNLCMNCLRCVQGCPKELITKSLNPEYKEMGDDFFTPEIISKLWSQAETGKIPVSGAGYPGPFSGPGFDSMWTDMSEIVRPTRDGIHGREYISTAIDLGRTIKSLRFDDSGALLAETPLLVDIPLPILLKVPPFGAISDKTLLGWAMAAKRLGTLLALKIDDVEKLPDQFRPWLVPVLEEDLTDPAIIPVGVRIVEIPWSSRFEKSAKIIKDTFPSMLVCVNIAMMDGMEEKAVSVADAGLDIIHLELGRYSEKEPETYDPRRVKDAIRSVHMKLVETNIRDEVTLVASGGFAMAEHVAKGMICGADAVMAEFQLLIGLQCRMCRRCATGLSCPVDIQDASAKWVAARVVNLFGAWHNQLIELMGAMGIRDARRLRGEVGRAMFFEDLDKVAFGSLGSAGEGFELE